MPCRRCRYALILMAIFYADKDYIVCWQRLRFSLYDVYYADCCLLPLLAAAMLLAMITLIRADY